VNEMNEEKQRELQNKERHLANLNREIDLATRQIPDIKVRQDMMDKEIELTNKQVEIALNHFKIIKPTWEFETTEEYHVVLKELNKLNHEKKMMEFGMLKMRLQEQVNAVNAQLESLTKEKDRVLKWIEENKEEVTENGN
jgi:peptidoglycan hydrolase CwlO-like protein